MSGTQQRICKTKAAIQYQRKIMKEFEECLNGRIFNVVICNQVNNSTNPLFMTYVEHHGVIAKQSYNFKGYVQNKIHGEYLKNVSPVMILQDGVCEDEVGIDRSEVADFERWKSPVFLKSKKEILEFVSTLVGLRQGDISVVLCQGLTKITLKELKDE